LESLSDLTREEANRAHRNVGPAIPGVLWIFRRSLTIRGHD
jgi:hypothetical protein